jgi:hypothetical protein
MHSYLRKNTVQHETKMVVVTVVPVTQLFV